MSQCKVEGTSCPNKAAFNVNDCPVCTIHLPWACRRYGSDGNRATVETITADDRIRL